MWFDCAKTALKKIESSLQQQFKAIYGPTMAQQC